MANEELPEGGKHWTEGKDFGGLDPSPLKKYKTEDEGWKGVLNTFKRVGELETQVGKFKGIDPEKIVSFPSDGAEPEEMARFRAGVLRRTGTPETAEEYTLEIPEGFPQNLRPSEQEMATFKARMHALGATPSQAQKEFQTSLDARRDGIRRQSRQQIESATKTLKAEFKEYDQLLDFAQKSISEWGMERSDMIRDLLFDDVGNPKNADLIAFLGMIGKEAFGEDGFIESHRRESLEASEKRKSYESRFPNTPKDLIR